MRLTASKDPETIKRYAHVRPAPPWRSRCSAACPGIARTCTLEKGHGGPHVAHGRFRKVLAVWAAGDRASRSGERARRVVRSERGSPEKGRLVSILKALRRGVVPSSMEEALFLVLFLSFVGFAVDWILRIIGWR